MQKLELWSRLRALGAWIFLTWVLLVWNLGFELFNPAGWARYRANHPDKLTISLLLLGIVTYAAVESLKAGAAQIHLDFDKVLRGGSMLLVAVFLWMFWNLPQEFGNSMGHLAVTVEGGNSISDPVQVTLRGDASEPLNVDIGN